jgi:hypothetical protein
VAGPTDAPLSRGRGRAVRDFVPGVVRLKSCYAAIALDVDRKPFGFPRCMLVRKKFADLPRGGYGRNILAQRGNARWQIKFLSRLARPPSTFRIGFSLTEKDGPAIAALRRSRRRRDARGGTLSAILKYTTEIARGCSGKNHECECLNLNITLTHCLREHALVTQCDNPFGPLLPASGLFASGPALGAPR